MSYPYERDKDFTKPLSIRPNGHQNKVCNQCEEEFMVIGSGELCMSCYNEQTCEECGVARYDEELLDCAVHNLVTLRIFPIIPLKFFFVKTSFINPAFSGTTSLNKILPTVVSIILKTKSPLESKSLALILT